MNKKTASQWATKVLVPIEGRVSPLNYQQAHDLAVRAILAAYKLRKAHKPKPSEALLERFEMFWKAWPNKKAKGAARKAWLRIKPSDQLLKTILAKIIEAKASEDWRKDGGAYVPHPATWLNAEGWEDVYKTNKPDGAKCLSEFKPPTAGQEQPDPNHRQKMKLTLMCMNKKISQEELEKRIAELDKTL